MRTEIRLSTSQPPPSNPWFWRVWEHGRLVARGQSPTQEEARTAAQAITGPEAPSLGRLPHSAR